jgi:hypothetical protein
MPEGVVDQPGTIGNAADANGPPRRKTGHRGEASHAAPSPGLVTDPVDDIDDLLVGEADVVHRLRIEPRLRPLAARS